MQGEWLWSRLIFGMLFDSICSVFSDVPEDWLPDCSNLKPIAELMRHMGVAKVRVCNVAIGRFPFNHWGKAAPLNHQRCLPKISFKCIPPMKAFCEIFLSDQATATELHFLTPAMRHCCAHSFPNQVPFCAAKIFTDWEILCKNFQLSTSTIHWQKSSIEPIHSLRRFDDLSHKRHCHCLLPKPLMWDTLLTIISSHITRREAPPTREEKAPYPTRWVGQVWHGNVSKSDEKPAQTN